MSTEKAQKVIDFINQVMLKRRTKNKLEVTTTDYMAMLQGIRQIINDK